MKQKNLIILCVAVILGILLISSMIILNANNTQNNSSNETEITINVTNNTTDNNNTSVSTQQTTKTSKKSNNKKSDSNKIEGDEITIQHDIDDNTEYIGTENNVYFKNKKTGKTYKRYLEPGSGVYDYVEV